MSSLTDVTYAFVTPEIMQRVLRYVHAARDEVLNCSRRAGDQRDDGVSPIVKNTRVHF